MELKNCKRCKKLFQYVVGKQTCPLCKDKEERDFKLVKEFLIKNPKSSIVEVYNETKVSIKQIEEFIKEERIELSQQSNILIYCESCNKPIYTGKLCQHCKMILSNQLKLASITIQEEQSKKWNSRPKFHTSPKR